MKHNFFDAIKALLPTGRAWDITQNTNMRRFFSAIAELGDALQKEIERVYLDYFPDTTRAPELWESVFRVVFQKDELFVRRQVLFAMWQVNNGGQSAAFMESILQNIVPAIRVVENVPVGNPRQSTVARFFVCGYKSAVCLNRIAACDWRKGNEIGSISIIANDVSSPYDIPVDSRYWGYCFFVCKGVVRNSIGENVYVEVLTLDKKYKNYIEYLILRTKLVQSVAVMDIRWI